MARALLLVAVVLAGATCVSLDRPAALTPDPASPRLDGRAPDVAAGLDATPEDAADDGHEVEAPVADADGEPDVVAADAFAPDGRPVDGPPVDGPPADSPPADMGPKLDTGPLMVELWATDDTQIDGSVAMSAYGGNQSFKTHATCVALLRFTVAPLPAGATILSATLSLQQWAGSDHVDPIFLHAVAPANAAWVEGNKADVAGGNGDPTWMYRDHGRALQWASNRTAFDWPVDLDPTPFASVSKNWNVSARVAWEVPPAVVQGWLAGPNPGLALRTRSGYHTFFAAKDVSDAALRPRLVVTYSMP